MLERLAREGNKTLDQFKEEYKTLNIDLKQKLAETLDGEQLKSLDTHRDELREGHRRGIVFRLTIGFFYATGQISLRM